jgi:hypothetical protein
LYVSRLGKSGSAGKKRLLPPSKTMFAWSIAQRAEDKNYFHTRALQWVKLGPDSVAIAAAAEAAALAAAETRQPHIPAQETPRRPAIYTPVPTRTMVAPPSHLVFKTRVVTRK